MTKLYICVKTNLTKKIHIRLLDLIWQINVVASYLFHFNGTLHSSDLVQYLQLKFTKYLTYIQYNFWWQQPAQAATQTVHFGSSTCTPVSLLLQLGQISDFPSRLSQFKSCTQTAAVIMGQPWKSVCLEEGFVLQIRVKDSGSQLPFLGLPQQKGALRHLEKGGQSQKGWGGRVLQPAGSFNTK